MMGVRTNGCLDPETDMHRGETCEETQGEGHGKAEDWSKASISEGTRSIAGKHQKRGERPRTDFPSEPQKEPSLLTPRSQISGFQNWEMIHVCYVKPLNSWHFVLAALGH